MIAKFQQELYELVVYNKEYQLITFHKDKAKEGFMEDEGIYYRPILIEDPELEDVFDVTFEVTYDTGLEEVNKLWQIRRSAEYVRDGKLLLRYTGGYLPAWFIEEKSVSHYYVDVKECKDLTKYTTYLKKDGKFVGKKVIEKELIEQENFIDEIIQCQNQNL